MSRLLPDIRMVPWILAILLLGLALPRAIVERSFLRYLQSLAQVCFGVIVPVAVFLLSALLVPEWKGGCRLGWIDCFHLGKLALLPLVLWATAALYCVEVMPLIQRPASWMITGLWTGAIVAGVCLVYGLVSAVHRADISRMAIVLIVPFYIALWHGIRASELSRTWPVAATTRRLALLGPLPLWILSLFWSRRIFERLPDSPPSCFVVTAAARGHESLVGPFTTVNRDGRVQRANRQLLRFWQFEALWRQRLPGSHRGFRRVYNVIGPAVARRIDSPWRANLVYCCLKPVEYFAAAVLGFARGPATRSRKIDARAP